MDYNRTFVVKALEIDRQLRDTLERSKDETIRITTMTVGVYLKEKHVDLELLQSETMNATKDIIKEFMQLFLPNISCKTSKNFNNSVVLKINKQAIKVFKNGSLHITGFKTVKDTIEVCDIVSTFLELVHGGSGGSGTYQICSFDIQLINVCFQMHMENKRKLNLMKVYEALRSHCQYYISFDTDRYAGVVLTCPQYKIMTFESGNIIITAVKTASQIEEAFLYIHTFFETHLRECVVDIADKAVNAGNASDQKNDRHHQRYMILK